MKKWATIRLKSSMCTVDIIGWIFSFNGIPEWVVSLSVLIAFQELQQQDTLSLKLHMLLQEAHPKRSHSNLRKLRRQRIDILVFPHKIGHRLRALQEHAKSVA